MNRKPITEHLKDLPIEYREEALRLHKEYPLSTDRFEKQSEALANAFPWDNVYNGYSVWNKWVNLYLELESKGL